MNRIFLLSLILGVALIGRAQDADPFFAGAGQLLLDPSRAGFAPGVAGTFIHQDQLSGTPGAWRNDLVSLEWCARNKKRQVDRWLGVGLVAARERQGAAAADFTSINVVPAFHLRTGERTFLSSGLELGWTTGTYADATGAWGSQYDGTRYDPSLPSGESWAADANTWMEMRAGVSWTKKQEAESARRRERDALVVGFAADHLGRIILREGAFAAPALPIRFTLHGLVEVPHGIWENGYFSGELVAHHQGPFHTGRIGLSTGKHLLNAVRSASGPLLLGFHGGLAYRMNDALVVNAGLDFGKASFGMAYGWPIFNPNTGAAGRRSFEVVLRIRGGS